MSRRDQDPRLLNLVFGDGVGSTAAARARISKRMFVRGLDLLTFDERPLAKGRRLTAREALDAYGFDVLCEVAVEGTALICESPEAAGRALRERREQLGLDVRRVAAQAEVTSEVVEALERSARVPIRTYERVARTLGLDERRLSFQANPGGNDRVAVRLRQLSDTESALTQPVVIALAEAAWVAMRQIELEDALGLSNNPPDLSKDDDFGGPGFPAYQVGYALADRLRAACSLGDEPIESMRELVERRIGIPVIQTELGSTVAGATIDSGQDRRAVVLNLSGANGNPFIRRATLAHELCHIVFDPRPRLQSLRVDSYRDLEQEAQRLADPVEQRANAFAVQLLIPQARALALYGAGGSDPLGDLLDRYGVSFTAARYQVWNGLQRRRALESITTGRYKPDPAWEGREGSTLFWHPLRGLEHHPSRAGRFSALVVRAAQKGVIAWDTAAEWLFSTPVDIQQSVGSLSDIYGDVFEGPVV